MRWIHLAIIILLAAATLVFAPYNLKTVNVSLLGLSIGTPLAILVFVVYVLSALAGGSLFALLRRSYAGSRRSPAVPS